MFVNVEDYWTVLMWIPQSSWLMGPCQFSAHTFICYLAVLIMHSCFFSLFTAYHCNPASIVSLWQEADLKQEKRKNINLEVSNAFPSWCFHRFVLFSMWHSSELISVSLLQWARGMFCVHYTGWDFPSFGSVGRCKNPPPLSLSKVIRFASETGYWTKK